MKTYELLLCFGGLIALCVGDVSLNNGQRPYSPSGWQPSPASLAVPGEYGAPPLPTAAVQVSQENVQFAGQVVEVNTPAAQRPNNAYLPPAATSQNQLGQLKFAQGLPREQPPKPFRSQLKQLNTGEVFLIPPQTSQFRNSERPSLRLQTSAQLNRPQQTQFQFPQQLPQFQQIQQFNSQPQFQQQQQQSDPSKYGPPAPPNNQYEPPSQTYPYPSPPPVEETPDEETTDETTPDDSDTTDGPVIAVANANGQYYILGKDNTLQRVVYETIQTEDDAINNGFTAQLRYSPVEPIRDPIYGYDAQGQLVRIYNKK